MAKGFTSSYPTPPPIRPPFYFSPFTAASPAPTDNNGDDSGDESPHVDAANLAWGWCCITTRGNFNLDLGRHLILWDLNLVIRFPRIHNYDPMHFCGTPMSASNKARPATPSPSTPLAASFVGSTTAIALTRIF
ncbi:hypothetical protein C8R43DRAFT_1138006 [Mycena crocata]|nr:hypothetical protein C8R43DRAFT_1138006 [Mycena crocata]